MIDCALIGCGYWGSNLKRYLEENNKYRLKYVCNSKFDLNQVWNDKQIKAVVVATPNETHYPIVKSALMGGKNVLSEKPLALKAGECEELKKMASDNDLVLLVEYTFTFSQGLNQAQRMVNEGEIGQVLGIEMAVRHMGRFKGGSVYWLLGSHMLSVLDMFTPIKDLHFEKADLVTFNGAVETGAISFKNRDIAGQIVISLNYPGKETRVIIYGETGTIIYNPVSQPTLQVENYERLRWTIAAELPRKRREFQIDEFNNLYYAVDQFYEALQGRAEGNVERAVSITRILEELQSKTKPVTI
jgi:UDP-2-acetamido-3-amino-2,3-dideoxy-glucuronate N-acetyltransferase